MYRGRYFVDSSDDEVSLSDLFTQLTEQLEKYMESLEVVSFPEDITYSRISQHILLLTNLTEVWSSLKYLCSTSGLRYIGRRYIVAHAVQHYLVTIFY